MERQRKIMRQRKKEREREIEIGKERDRERERDSEPEPPFGPSVVSLCHPCITTSHLPYRFPIFETSATARCRDQGNMFLEPGEKTGRKSKTGIASLQPGSVGFNLAMLLDTVVNPLI